LTNPINAGLVGNPEVIRKQPLGNRSDGFRSCQTHFPRVWEHWELPSWRLAL